MQTRAKPIKTQEERSLQTMRRRIDTLRGRVEVRRGKIRELRAQYMAIKESADSLRSANKDDKAEADRLLLEIRETCDHDHIETFKDDNGNNRVVCSMCEAEFGFSNKKPVTTALTMASLSARGTSVSTPDIPETMVCLNPVHEVVQEPASEVAPEAVPKKAEEFSYQQITKMRNVLVPWLPIAWDKDLRISLFLDHLLLEPKLTGFGRAALLRLFMRVFHITFIPNLDSITVRQFMGTHMRSTNNLLWDRASTQTVERTLRLELGFNGKGTVAYHIKARELTTAPLKG